MVRWRSRLRPASWRGVPFEVDGDSMELGRRGVSHQFPGRDKPVFQDLGRAARVVKMQAFVIGDDYDWDRDALVEALERPGIGVLVHPFYGRLTGTMKRTELKQGLDGGRAVFDLEFEESGELIFPRALPDPADRIAATASAARSTSDAALAAAFGPTSAGAALADQTYAAMASPSLAFVIEQTAQELARLLGHSSGAFLEALAGKEDLAALFDTQDLWRLLAAAQMLTPSVYSPTSEVDEELQRVVELIHTRVRVYAATAAATLAVSQTFESWDQAEAVRTALVDILALEEERAVTQGLYQALFDLRIVTSLGIEDTGARLPREQTLVLGALTDGLALAYELYEDPGRLPEILRRNGTLHPAFMWGSTTVLSR